MIRKIIVGIALSAVFSAQAADLTGRVVQVADGDTISVVDNRNREYRIRFLGIDAPERGQTYGNYCRKNLAGKIAGKPLTSTTKNWINTDALRAPCTTKAAISIWNKFKTAALGSTATLPETSRLIYAFNITQPKFPPAKSASVYGEIRIL